MLTTRPPRPSINDCYDYKDALGHHFRYIMMCRPFFRLKYRIRASTFILPILLTAPLYTLPRFFEVESYSNNSYVCSSNSTYWFIEANVNESVLGVLGNKSFFEGTDSSGVAISHG